MFVWLRFRKPSLVSHLVNDRADYFGKIACFEEELVAGTTTPFPIMTTTLKPDSSPELTKSLLNCTYTHTHERAAVSAFGLVCLGSSHSMWAKGHVSLALSRFLPGILFFSLVALSPLRGFEARAGQDGG